jgi:hypothetical protein
MRNDVLCKTYLRIDPINNWCTTLWRLEKLEKLCADKESECQEEANDGSTRK